jgi:hypothetical protein
MRARLTRGLRNKIYYKIAEVACGSLSSINERGSLRAAYARSPARTIVRMKKARAFVVARTSRARARMRARVPAFLRMHLTLGTSRIAVLAPARESPFPLSALHSHLSRLIG